MMMPQEVVPSHSASTNHTQTGNTSLTDFPPGCAHKLPSSLRSLLHYEQTSRKLVRETCEAGKISLDLGIKVVRDVEENCTFCSKKAMPSWKSSLNLHSLGIPPNLPSKSVSDDLVQFTRSCTKTAGLK